MSFTTPLDRTHLPDDSTSCHGYWYVAQRVVVKHPAQPGIRIWATIEAITAQKKAVIIRLDGDYETPWPQRTVTCADLAFAKRHFEAGEPWAQPVNSKHPDV